jgi:hypothetical protein
MSSALAAAEIEAIAPGQEDSLDEYLGALDGRISDLDEWMERASGALLTFETRGGFCRNSMPAGSGPGTTSTARSLSALHEYRCFLLEEGREVPDAIERALRKGFRWIRKIANDGPKKVCEASENGPNSFTFSHMLIAMGFAVDLAAKLGRDRELSGVRSRLDRVTRKLAEELREEVEDAGIMGLKREDQAAHHFVTLHTVRALDVVSRVSGVEGAAIRDSGAIRTSISSTVLEQLGYHSAKVMARFDPGALVFAAALLGLFKAADREQLTEHAVKVASAAQTDDGAWLSEQVVAASGTSRIYVSSYEVGLGLTYLASRELAYGNAGLARSILPCLEKTMELVRASYNSGEARNDGFKGWANDRSRWPKLIESWATASVLSFMLRYRMVMHELRQQLVLARYGVSIKKAKDDIGWPDLELAFPSSMGSEARRAARVQIDDALRKYSDPSEGRELTAALRNEVLAPVLDEPGHRPDKASLIVYGPPGSRKTSLAKHAATGLGWPILTLSPPDFLGEHGLDGFEGAAARIFNDLMRLRRVVILFDECEDFFKPRRRDSEARSRDTSEGGGRETKDAGGGPDSGVDQEDGAAEGDSRSQEERPESRTIGAFLTAGMLPRLQRLRDNRWVIFILATNIKRLDELDEAVRRPGRFDFADELRHPELPAQQRYIDEHWRAKELRPAVRQRFKVALSDYAVDGEPEVPYAVIDYVVAGILDDEWPSNRKQIAARLRQRMHKVGHPPSLLTPLPA